MSSLKERQHQLREDAIIEVAERLLQEQGYASLNMDEAAAEVGISKATLYQHFASKDELVVQTILCRMKEGEKTIRGITPPLPPVELLEHVLRYSVKKRISMAASHFELPPHLREDPRIKEQHAKFADFLGNLIIKGQRDGSIRPDLAVPVVVRMFFTIFSPAHRDLLREEVVSPEELGETLVTIFLKGIQLP